MNKEFRRLDFMKMNVENDYFKIGDKVKFTPPKKYHTFLKLESLESGAFPDKIYTIKDKVTRFSLAHDFKDCIVLEECPNFAYAEKWFTKI